MLKHPIPGKRRMAVGLVLAGFVIAGTAYTVWATRPANHVVADAASPATQSVPRSQAQSVAPPAGHADAGAYVDVRSKQTAPPKYPADAAANRVTGKVVLVIDVAADGSVAAARVEKSEPVDVFDQVTLDAAKQWKFSPAMKDGKPVAGRVRVPVHFEMDRDEDAQGNGADGKA